ncbi:MAG: aldehyde dehydrogenase family protein [Gammaproteobacteria bacterium]|nr:aldehyde dehydrogenase family protein [Gammaproteobacteria bacterium]
MTSSKAIKETGVCPICKSDPTPGTDKGPLITRAHFEKVRYVDPGVAEGAQLVVDGRSPGVAGHEEGFFLGGCLFDKVTPAPKAGRRLTNACHFR